MGSCNKGVPALSPFTTTEERGWGGGKVELPYNKRVSPSTSPYITASPACLNTNCLGSGCLMGFRWVRVRALGVTAWLHPCDVTGVRCPPPLCPLAPPSPFLKHSTWPPSPSLFSIPPALSLPVSSNTLTVRSVAHIGMVLRDNFHGSDAHSSQLITLGCQFYIPLLFFLQVLLYGLHVSFSDR